jgi:hypothetical protein
VFLAKNYKAKVIGIDADPAVAAYLNFHAEINVVSVGFEKKLFQKVSKADFTNVHTVIGADIFLGGVNQTLISNDKAGTKLWRKTNYYWRPRTSAIFKFGRMVRAVPAK